MDFLDDISLILATKYFDKSDLYFKKEVAEKAFNSEFIKVIQNAFQDGIGEIKIREHKKVYSQGDIIYTPNEKHYKSESNYLHAIFHETAHIISRYLGQSVDFVIAGNEAIKAGYDKDLNKSVFPICKEPEDIIKLPEPLKAYFIEYLKEETKVELCALYTILAAGILLDEKDINYGIANIAGNEKFLEAAGLLFEDRKDKLIKDTQELLDRTIDVFTSNNINKNSLDLADTITKYDEKIINNYKAGLEEYLKSKDKERAELEAKKKKQEEVLEQHEKKRPGIFAGRDKKTEWTHTKSTLALDILKTKSDLDTFPSKEKIIDTYKADNPKKTAKMQMSLTRQKNKPSLQQQKTQQNQTQTQSKGRKLTRE